MSVKMQQRHYEVKQLTKKDKVVKSRSNQERTKF